MSADEVAGTSEPKTWIEGLWLENFRQFATVEVGFESDLTVLVAPNGGGKTAVLDAVAVAWQAFANVMEGDSGGAHLVTTDARQERGADGRMVEKRPVRVAAYGVVDGYRKRWGWPDAPPPSERFGSKGRGGFGTSVAMLRAHLDDYIGRRRSDPPLLPVLACYGTDRLWQAANQQSDQTVDHHFVRPLDVYRGALRGSASGGTFAAWFEAMMLEGAAERESGVASPHRPALAIEAVRRATDAVLKPSGWSRLSWDFVARQVLASHPEHGRLPVSVLSDGTRNLIALVADLAHRCVRLNPHLGADAPAKTPGVVLIDEVDLHLHPAWQQTVIGSLRAAFPAVQLIVTTHSPQVLSTVEARCIRLIELGEGAQGIVTTPGQQTRGVASGDVLAAVMGVDPIPDVPEWAKLRRYHAMIEDGEWEGEAAKALRAELDAHFGARHPAMLDCDRLIRFQAFRLRRAPGGSER